MGAFPESFDYWLPRALAAWSALVLASFYFAQGTAMQLVAGGSYAIFAPGLALIYALFDARELRPFEYLVLSIGAAVIVSIFAQLAANSAGIPLLAEASVYIVIAATLFLVGVGVLRRKGLIAAFEKIYVREEHNFGREWLISSSGKKALGFFAALLIVLFIALIISSQKQPTETYVELHWQLYRLDFANASSIQAMLGGQDVTARFKVYSVPPYLFRPSFRVITENASLSLVYKGNRFETEIADGKTFYFGDNAFTVIAWNRNAVMLAGYPKQVPGERNGSLKFAYIVQSRNYKGEIPLSLKVKASKCAVVSEHTGEVTCSIGQEISAQTRLVVPEQELRVEERVKLEKGLYRVEVEATPFRGQPNTIHFFVTVE